MVIGYTAGVFDCFHVGHLNLLKNARGMVDRLVVGVTTDDLVSYKNKTNLIPFSDRVEIVRSIKYVDAVIPQDNMNKLETCLKLNAQYMFVGDDWYNTERFNEYESEFSQYGIKIIYFPYTKGISSTIIRDRIQSAD